MTIEGLGKKFQEARLARKLTLDEAARMTKIRPSRLAEIEADDFSQFPSLAYAKGFILIYGKFLDVDVTQYMEAFEGSEAVTVDGYSYLQDNPAPKPVRTRVTPRRSRPVAASSSSEGRPTSLMPLVMGIVVLIVGFSIMRFIMNLQRIGHKAEPTPTPIAQAAATTAPMPTPISVLAPPPAPTATATAVTQATQAPVGPPPVAGGQPSSAPTNLAATAPAPQASAKPPAAGPPPAATAVASKAPVTLAPAPSVAAKPVAAAPAPSGPEPEVRKAEPVRAEDLKANAATTGTGTATAAAETSGANKVSIRPLKKTYLRVVVDNGAGTPTFEKWVSPSETALEFKGQHFDVRVLDRNAVQIKKNGKTIEEGDSDVKVE